MVTVQFNTQRYVEMVREAHAKAIAEVFRPMLS